jgi:chemotaxis protein CheX
MLAGSQAAHEGWIQVLEVATREVFELMLGCKLTAPESPFDVPLDITAMVGLAGQLCGVMSIRCGQNTSVMMASKMLGGEPTKLGPEVCDAFGEICNMVAGNFKNKISGLGDGCLLSVPTVITGSDYSLHALTNSAALEVRVLFENHPMVVSLEIHS